MTQPQTFIVLDRGLWNVLLRRLANGKWLQVDRTMHTAFNADSLIYRLTFRIDADLTPVAGPESTTLISIRTA